MKRMLYAVICLILTVTMKSLQSEIPPSNESLIKILDSMPKSIEARNNLMHSMLTFIHAKINTLAASDSLYQAAKNGTVQDNEIAQKIDESATEFIACLTQEIYIEQFTRQMMEANGALSHILEDIYNLIPEKFKSSTIHRSNIPLIQRLLDSIKQADKQNLMDLFEYLAKQVRRKNIESGHITPLI